MAERYNPYKKGSEETKIQQAQFRNVIEAGQDVGVGLAKNNPVALLARGGLSGIEKVQAASDRNEESYAAMADRARRRKLGLPEGIYTGREAGIAFQNDPTKSLYKTKVGAGATVPQDQISAETPSKILAVPSPQTVTVGDATATLSNDESGFAKSGRLLNNAVREPLIQDNVGFTSNGLTVTPRAIEGSAFATATPEARRAVLTGATDRDKFIPGRMSTQQAGYQAREARFASGVRNLQKRRDREKMLSSIPKEDRAKFLAAEAASSSNDRIAGLKLQAETARSGEAQSLQREELGRREESDRLTAEHRASVLAGDQESAQALAEHRSKVLEQQGEARKLLAEDKYQKRLAVAIESYNVWKEGGGTGMKRDEYIAQYLGKDSDATATGGALGAYKETYGDGA